MSRTIRLYEPSTNRPLTQAFKTSQIVLVLSALLFVIQTIIDFRYNMDVVHRAGLDTAKAAVGGGATIVLGLILYGTVYYLMNRRLNNGRMIGMGLAILGLIMSIVNIVIDIPGRPLSAAVYAVIAVLSIVWLAITNKREVTDLLKK